MSLQYREAGTGGSSSSTIKGKLTAIGHFATFLATLGLDYEKSGEDAICNESILRQFGTYLIITTSADLGKQMAPDTATQYFSGTVMTLKKLYPTNPVFNPSLSWNSEVRSDIQRLITRRHIAEGLEVKDKAHGVGRLLMIDISKELLSVGTIKSIESRAILCTSFHAVERAGEVALLTWSCLYWNPNEELLGGKWMQQKTTNVQEMTFFADAESYEICEFHSLACYLVVGGGSRGSRGADGWVFPTLSEINASKAITTILKDLSKRIDGLHSEVTATDIRVGSANDIVNAEGGGFEVAVARGGWKAKGETICALFEYYMNTTLSINIAGRILSGFKNPRSPSYPPRFNSFVTSENKAKVMSMLGYLLDKRFHISVSPVLGSFAKVMFASLLQYHEPMQHTYGMDHIIVRYVIDSARKFNISNLELTEWGNLVRRDVALRNAARNSSGSQSTDYAVHCNTVRQIVIT